MADPTSPRVIVVDASVLINFLRVGRLGLLASLPGFAWVIPEDVASEVSGPEQRQQIEQAIASQQFRTGTITEPEDLVLYAELRRTLGRGEAACVVLVARHGWLVASDEKGRSLREATARLGEGRLVNTCPAVAKSTTPTRETD